ncbi:MAG TPA: STING domain-containing protein [Chthoniobacterales bacterium]|nr:STING domain-containing protein [Chthoniobacterales bacterium]
MPPDLKKTCFVIGPMGKGHIDRLRWLAKDVIQPILGDAYSVFTPDVNELGNIMDHVIRSCDRADLVVADTTGNNPNVLYEMAILDAMGRACIPVKFQIDKKKKIEAMPFDRAQYRYFELEQETAAAREKLKDVIEKVQAQRNTGELFSNPITNFFQNPLNSLASARGLARGYVRNFVTPCLQGVIIDGPDFAVGKGKLQVQTLLPTRLAQATRGAVEKVFEQGRIKKVVVEAAGRSITAYVWAEHRDAKNNPIIVDIPTAMAALFDNVHARLGSGNPRDPKSADFRSLEDDEIGQFVRYLKIFSNEGIANGLMVANYKMINVADSFEPNLLD